jgi:hypothetical protein
MEIEPQGLAAAYANFNRAFPYYESTRMLDEMGATE